MRAPALPPGPGAGHAVLQGASVKAPRRAAAPELALGRYRIANRPPLGTGGWCVVREAEDTFTGQSVAVKTYTEQAAQGLEDSALAARLAHEVGTFKALGVGPRGAVASGRPDPRRFRQANARLWLVNLLDYSRDTVSGHPGRGADGHYYTVLELADESLSSWLERRATSKNFVCLEEFRKIANAIASALLWLHSCGYCHLDVKPENIMRFGSTWKLIDLESCLPANGKVPLSRDHFTPLYASPEVAHFMLGPSMGPSLMPSCMMDLWAAGVVLLDVLTHSSALQETKSGFDTAALFEEEAVPFEGWYQWLADPTPLDLHELVLEPASSLEFLQQFAELRDLLRRLLEKDPAGRLSAVEFQGHPFLLAGLGQRVRLEETFHRVEASTGRGSLTRKQVSALLAGLGFCSFEVDALLLACGPFQKGHASFKEIVDFFFGTEDT